MLEDDVQPKIVRELPGDVAEYFTTFGRPRFIGIPRDDQLEEDSSMEGILHGRAISEVYTQDTKELEGAGVDWDRGVYVLQCLAIACAYHDIVISQTYEELQARIYQGKYFYEVDQASRDLYEREAKAVVNRHSRLVDFGGRISAFATGARVQVDNPIKNSEPQGDGTPFDLIANESPERKIVFDGDDIQFTTTVNAQTLLQAEAYHLLEKGNRYALTGAQLARLVSSFNEEVFLQQIKPWFDSEQGRIMAGLKVIMGHGEKIRFNDGVEVEHDVGRNGCLNFLLSNKPFSRLMITLDNGQIKNISIDGKDFHNAVSIKNKGGKFYQKVRRDSTLQSLREPENKLINQGDRLFDIVQIAQQLHQTAKDCPEGVLLINSQQVHSLATKAMTIVNP